MAGVVIGVDWLAADLGAGKRLALLVGTGALAYFAFLFAFARPIVDEVLGLFRPKREAVACARSLDALDIGEHRLGLGLDLVHPELDEIADRDESDQGLALHHRQMADAPPGHQRQGAEDVGRRAQP